VCCVCSRQDAGVVVGAVDSLQRAVRIGGVQSEDSSIVAAAAAACLRRWEQGGLGCPKISNSWRSAAVKRRWLGRPCVRSLRRCWTGSAWAGCCCARCRAKTGLPTPLDPRRQRMKLTRPRLCACLLVVAAKTPLGDSSGDQVKTMMFCFSRWSLPAPPHSNCTGGERWPGYNSTAEGSIHPLPSIAAALSFRISKPATNSQ
jgi:hypothetical protein